MSRDRTNRIEVDLKLKNIEKLQEFGRTFDNSIEKLGTMLGSYAEQVSGAANTVANAGKLSPNASTGSGISGPPARMGGTSTSGGFGGGFINLGGGYGKGDGSFSNTPPPSEDSGSAGGQGTFEQQYIRAQKRIGNIPVGFRQTLGYLAESGPPMDDQGYLLDRNGTRTGEKAPMWRRGAATANEWMFRESAFRANAMLAQGHLQSLNAHAVLGQQLGRSREGWQGTGIGSSAFWTGMKEDWKTKWQAKFGFTPNYSMEQAKRARQTLQEFGYSGDTADMLADQLKQIEIRHGIDPKTQMAAFDPFLRFGGTENLNQLTSILQALPAAADAAHMHLAEFNQQLAATAQQVAESTGMTVGGSMNALRAFSMTTGLAPSRAGALFSDPKNVWMAAGMTGRHITEILEGHDKGASMRRIGLTYFKNATGGYSAEQLMRLRKTDKEQYYRIMDGVNGMWMNNHDVFGGQTPRELIADQVRNHGRSLGHQSITEQLPLARSTGRIEQMLRGWGGKDGAHMLSEFETYLSKHPNDNLQKQRDRAIDLISKHQNAAQTRAAKQVTIGLAGDAAKYFKIISDDTAHSNHRSWFDRYAMPAIHAGEWGLEHLP